MTASGANGLLQTTGFHSDAIAAQSISAGGGQGTIAIGTLASGTSASYALGATGNGTVLQGGSAGNVTVSNSANKIVTIGDLSTALLAQSIGGGGGDAAFNLGGPVSGAVSGLLGGSSLNLNGGGTLNVTNSGSIGTAGAGSFGILAQSIGGGGGNGGFDAVSGAVSSARFTMGGNGETSSNGGVVQLTNSGQVVTLGNGAAGVSAQSIGGGGGEAGYAANLNLGTSGATALGIIAGGSGAENLNFGGSVTLNNTAQVATSGANAFALLAQSIGGGGGNAGIAANGKLATGTTAGQFSVQLGGTGSGTATTATPFR